MRTSRLAFAVLTLSLVASAAAAQSPIAVTICPAPAPNAFGSPSYPGWRANALAALQTGGCATIGDRDVDPTACAVSPKPSPSPTASRWPTIATRC
jgi:hypothetical protein